jgi:hypothetical protein
MFETGAENSFIARVLRTIPVGIRKVWVESTGLFEIIVGFSVVYNFQTGNNKNKPLTEYGSVTQSIKTSMPLVQRCQIQLLELHFHIP